MKSVFAIPISDPDGAEKFIIYRPLAGLAFVGNRVIRSLSHPIAVCHAG